MPQTENPSQFYADAELAVLGSLLISPECLPVVKKHISGADFSIRANRIIFETICDMDSEGERIDPVTVITRLRETKNANDNMRSYFFTLMDAVPTAANAEEYARIVAEDSRLRKLRDIAEEITQGVLIRGDAASLASLAADKLAEIDSAGGEKRPLSTVEAFVQWTSRYDAISRSPELAYVKSGYASLDSVLSGGFMNGLVYILAGRPGMGKSTVALNIAERVARDRGVLFISLEMSSLQITAKRISIYAGLPVNKVLNGGLSDGELSSAVSVCSRLAGSRLEIADELVGVDEIPALASQVKDLGLIVIDQLSFLCEASEYVSMRDATTKASKELSRLAKRLNKPILLLCQINRENTSRKDKRPTMADLRESGAVEQDAGAVLLLHREKYYKRTEDESEEDEDETETLEIIVDKNRFGRTGSVKLCWHGSSGRVAEYSDDYRKML